MAASINLMADRGQYEVRIASSSLLSMHRKTMNSDGISTVTIFAIVSLTAKEPLSIEIGGPKSKVSILQGSSFSAVYIGPAANNLSEFSVSLPADKSFPSGREDQILSDYIPASVLKEKSIAIDTRRNYQFAMPRNGIYLLCLHLHLNMSMRDEVTVKVAVWDIGIETILALGEPALLPWKHTMITSILLTGVVSLGNSDFVTISLKSKQQKSFTVMKTSQVSLTLVRSGILAAGFKMRDDVSINSGASTVKRLRLTALPYEAYLLNQYLSMDNISFQCPLRGLYLVALNIVLTNQSPGSQTVSLRIRRSSLLTNENGAKDSNIFTATFNVIKGTASYNPSGVYALQQNDRLSLHVDSKSAFTVSERSSIFISLIDLIETGRTVIAQTSSVAEQIPLNFDRPFLFEKWLPEIEGSRFFVSHSQYTTLESGFYLVSCNFQLRVDITANLLSLEAMLVVYFGDQNINFGLRDMSYFSGHKNESKVLLLNVNGVLKAGAKSELKTLLKMSNGKQKINVTILCGRLSVSFYDPKPDHATESFRYVIASTKLLPLKNDVWEYIGKENIQSSKNGEFKTADVEFNGPHFLAKGPLVGFASATTKIQGINGVLEYGLVVISGSEILPKDDLTIETTVQSQTETTLRWSGLVYLEPWQQLSLAIKRKQKASKVTDAAEASHPRSSWSSLSFLGLSPPEYTPGFQAVPPVPR